MFPGIGILGVHQESPTLPTWYNSKAHCTAKGKTWVQTSEMTLLEGSTMTLERISEGFQNWTSDRTSQTTGSWPTSLSGSIE